jgi:hypothetical protein
MSNRVIIRVAKETVSDFNGKDVQQFKFADIIGRLSLTDAAKRITDLLQIDATEFEILNGLQANHLVWNMTVSANREYLYIVAIPEPTTYGLGLGAMALAFAAVRRRKTKKKSESYFKLKTEWITSHLE